MNALQLIWNLVSVAARDIIELEDVQFTGNSAYDDNGRFFVNNPGPINYSDATPEADDAWKNLTLEGRMYHLLPKMTKESGKMVIDDVGFDIERDFVISEQEAKQLWPNDYMVHWHHKKKGYSIGLDVFHTLHCIVSTEVSSCFLTRAWIRLIEISC